MSVQFAQITDTHIVCDERDWLAEPRTQTTERLLRVLSDLQRNPIKPDFVLATGDLVDDHEDQRGAYSKLKKMFSKVEVPIFPIPGNHDDRVLLAEAFGDHADGPYFHYRIDREEGLTLLCLDSSVPGKAEGRFCKDRLDWIRGKLEETRDRRVVLVLHHVPLEVGFFLFDSINLKNWQEFDELVGEFDHVEAVLTGHYHHHLVSRLVCGVPLFVAPSVAPTHHFERPEQDFVSALELENPSYSTHVWGNGRLLSRTHSVPPARDRINWEDLKVKT